jgi:transcriptional regulator with XRE-family HTH domain
MVSQKDIAEYLGLDRTTVTKILNRDPKYSASEATKSKVFRAAERLGYDFTTIRRPFKREYGRTPINAGCEVTITLENGELFDSGNSIATNIGVGGALLTGIKTSKMTLPLANFTLSLRIREIPGLGDMIGECEIVRLADNALTGEPELGVRFINATHRDRRRIKEFVDKSREKQAATRSQGARRDGDEPSADEQGGAAAAEAAGNEPVEDGAQQ